MVVAVVLLLRLLVHESVIVQLQVAVAIQRVVAVILQVVVVAYLIVKWIHSQAVQQEASARRPIMEAVVPVVRLVVEAWAVAVRVEVVSVVVAVAPAVEEDN